MNMYSKKALLRAMENDDLEVSDAEFMLGYLEAF